jgi:hypothetical protein
MKRLLIIGFALLLGQGPALAQDEPPAEPVEEAAQDEGEAPEEAAPEGEAASGQDAAAEDAEATVWGGEHTGFIDLYYVPTLEFNAVGLGEGDASGAGGRGQFQFWKFLAVSAEYSTHTFDPGDAKLDDQRFGLGVATRNDGGDTAGLFVEFEKMEIGNVAFEVDGLGLHARMSHAAGESLRIYADIGYKRLESDFEKFSAFEFNAGAVYSFGPFGVFADWRRNQLEGKDSGVRISLEGVRVGARWSFGG